MRINLQATATLVVEGRRAWHLRNTQEISRKYECQVKILSKVERSTFLFGNPTKRSVLNLCYWSSVTLWAKCLVSYTEYHVSPNFQYTRKWDGEFGKGTEGGGERIRTKLKWRSAIYLPQVCVCVCVCLCVCVSARARACVCAFVWHCVVAAKQSYLQMSTKSSDKGQDIPH